CNSKRARLHADRDAGIFDHQSDAAEAAAGYDWLPVAVGTGRVAQAQQPRVEPAAGADAERHGRLLYFLTRRPKTGSTGLGCSAGLSTRTRGRYASKSSSLSSGICLLMNISMSVRRIPCSGVTKAMAMPSAPIRPVRPMRWT